MFLVTGGYGISNYLDSTETFDPLVGSWTESRAKLPRPMDGLRAANIIDSVLMFGNYLYYSDSERNVLFSIFIQNS